MAGRALSNKNILDARFNVLPFEGEWKAHIGLPELTGSWSIYGGSGSGKTAYALQLAKYFASLGERVAYSTTEQRLSRTFQKSWKRAEMWEAGSKVIVYSKMSYQEVLTKLRASRQSPRVVFFDSLTAMPDFKRQDYLDLMDEFPRKLFIFLSHIKNKLPYPAIAEYIRKLSDVKTMVEGYMAFSTTRYEDAETGEGGQDFIIWRQGAEEYWPNKF